MNLELQTDIVRYLLHHPSGKTLIPNLPESVFDTVELQISTQLIKEFHKKFGRLPGNTKTLIAFTEEQPEGKGALEILETMFDKLYSPLVTDEALVEGKAIQLIKEKMILDLMREQGPRLLSEEPNQADLSSMLKRMGSIVNLGIGSGNTPLSILDDLPPQAIKKVWPTHLQQLNNLTAARGFHAPQLVVFMAGPKGFKTGFMLSITINQVLQGAKIAYFDYENGQSSIWTRASQTLLQCTEAELMNAHAVDLGNDRTLEMLWYEMRATVIRMSGDFKAFEFPQQTSTREAQADLDAEFSSSGWKPDICAWDYADLMAPANQVDRGNRFQIQGVYKNIVEFNKVNNVLSYTQSQVRREAISSKVISMEDFAEDIGKAANAHAAFAICRDQDEIKAGVARIVPVMQRAGKRFDGENFVPIAIDEGRQSIEELWLPDNFDNLTDN